MMRECPPESDFVSGSLTETRSVFYDDRGRKNKVFKYTIVDEHRIIDLEPFGNVRPTEAELLKHPDAVKYVSATKKTSK